MFLLILYLLYYIVLKIYAFLLYIIYKYITWADIFILLVYNMLPILYKNKEVIDLHRLIYVYCVLFPWYILVYIFTTISYCLYLLFIGELTKCIRLVKKLVILFIFFFVIGILKVLFMLAIIL